MVASVDATPTPGLVSLPKARAGGLFPEGRVLPRNPGLIVAALLGVLAAPSFAAEPDPSDGPPSRSPRPTASAPT